MDNKKDWFITVISDDSRVPVTYIFPAKPDSQLLNENPKVFDSHKLFPLFADWDKTFDRCYPHFMKGTILLEVNDGEEILFKRCGQCFAILTKGMQWNCWDCTPKPTNT
jgi:hypothetical protein